MRLKRISGYVGDSDALNPLKCATFLLLLKKEQVAAADLLIHFYHLSVYLKLK